VPRKLSHLVSSRSRDYFATVLCALVDIDAHELTPRERRPPAAAVRRVIEMTGLTSVFEVVS
jgi:hypothetical protein